MNSTPPAPRQGIRHGKRAWVLTWHLAGPIIAGAPCFLAFPFETFSPASSIWCRMQSMHSHPATRNELAQWIGKLESLSKLAPGWNRHGAPAPSKEAIRAARQFIEALVNDGQPPTRVAASAVGGVGVTRQVGERLAYIEFYNDGAACALLADDAGDE